MFLFVAAALVALDQLTKAWAVNTLLNGPSVPLGLGFHFTYTQNTGAAFGILSRAPAAATLLLGVLSAVVALGILIFLLRRSRTLPRVQVIAFTLILAGAVGNMIDRFRFGYVRDFIHFYLPNFNFPIFNVADGCVVIGAALLILASFFERPKREPDYQPES